MLGSNPGHTMSQNEVIADLFAENGHQILRTSTIPARFQRLVDMLRSLIIWRHEIDIVVHAIFSGASFQVANVTSWLASRLGLPQIFVLRGGALPEYAQQHPAFVQRVFSRAKAIIAPSGYMAQAFSDWGLDVLVIPNVVEIEHYPYQFRSVLQPRLLWMRSFHDIYHPEMAVNVLAQLRNQFPNVMLTMAGQDKGSLSGVKKMVAEKGLEKHVNFVGFLDMAGKQKMFAEHDVYLNTNRIDNMPVSVVEAAAFGLPVVATDVGGIPHLLKHEETGILVPNENVQQMAQGVERLLRRPELAGRLSGNGRLLAEASAWPIVRARWEHLFAAVI